MKKKYIAMLLGTVLMLGVTGMSSCGRTTDSEDNSSQEENVDQEDSTEISEYSEKEFDTMASITLGSSILIEGTGASVEDTIVTITEAGEYIVEGSLEGGAIVVDADGDVKITLNGVTLSNQEGPAIYEKSADSLTIEAIEGTENVLSDGSEYVTDENGETEGTATISSKDDLYLIGNGEVTITGNYKHAVKGSDSVWVEGGTWILSGEKDGIHANDYLTVDGGSIEVVSCNEGLEAEIGVTVNGGTISINCEDDGINGGSDITINGGTIYVNASTGDGIDSNGSLSIHGGLILAFGGQEPECGLDCDQNEIIITGGTIIATGGSNSSPSESEDTQYAVLLGAASAGDTIGILAEDGTTILAFEVSENYSNLLFSSADISEGGTYTIYTGGTITGGTEYYGYYEGASYEGGTESKVFTADSMLIEAGGSVDSMMGGGMMQGGPGGRGNWSDSEMQEGEMPEMPEGGMPEGEMPEMPEGGMPEGEMPQNNSNGENK
ncbi:MAG: carbohydrate-binding domain-containing protein [Roseburia sp.]